MRAFILNTAGDSNASTLTSPLPDRQIGNSLVNLAHTVSTTAPFHTAITHYITRHGEMSTRYVNTAQISLLYNRLHRCGMTLHRSFNLALFILSSNSPLPRHTALTVRCSAMRRVGPVDCVYKFSPTDQTGQQRQYASRIRETFLKGPLAAQDRFCGLFGLAESSV